MTEDIFGFTEKNPPYSPTKTGVKLNSKNWKKVLVGDDYDLFFDYYECERSGGKWFDRRVKPEYKDKIVGLDKYLPIEELKKI